MNYTYSEEAENIAAAAQRLAEEKAEKILHEKVRQAAVLEASVRGSEDAPKSEEERQITQLPLPSIFEQYEQIVPGSAARILEMAEREQAHRHAQEQMKVESRTVDARIALIFAFSFIICILGLCIGGAFILTGKELAGGLIGVGGFLGISSVFGVIATQSLQKNRQSKKEPFEALRPSGPNGK